MEGNEPSDQAAAEGTSAHSERAKGRILWPWPLIALVGIHVLFDRLVDKDSWAQLFVVVFLTQPVLLAMWAVCGSGWFFRRMLRATLLATLAYIIVMQPEIPAGTHKTGWDTLG